MRIKITGEKVNDDRALSFNNLDWFSYKITDSYKTTVSTDTHYHDLNNNEVIEIVLNDKITLYLSEYSFLSLIPKTFTDKGYINLADSILQISDVTNQANIINIHSVRFINTFLNMDNESSDGNKSSIEPEIKNNKIESKDNSVSLTLPELINEFEDHFIPEVIKKLEQQFMPEPGIYHSDELDRGIHKVSNPLASISTREPILLLIHGTTSNTESTFSDLWQSLESDLWIDHIEDNYDKQIYAYEHHTLSKSPIENTLELVRQLPKGTLLTNVE